MQVLCAGQLAVDVIALPVEDVDYAVDTLLVDRIEMKSGGDSMNVAAGLATLNNDVAFIGRIGNDAFGLFLAQKFQALGIDPKGLIQTKDVPTCSSVVLINGAGDRTFIHCIGANERFVQEDVTDDQIAKAGIVHMGGTFTMPGIDGEGAAQLFKRARKAGALTSMDVTYDSEHRWMNLIKPSLKDLDFFIPSINEAKYIAGTDDPDKIADVLLSAGVKTAVIKLGAKGCLVANAQTRFRQHGYKANVVDTTGAGDAFVAGFLSGIANALPLQECAKMACAAGSICVESIGAAPAAITPENIQRKIKGLAGL